MCRDQIDAWSVLINVSNQSSFTRPNQFIFDLSIHRNRISLLNSIRVFAFFMKYKYETPEIYMSRYRIEGKSKRFLWYVLSPINELQQNAS